MATGSRLVGVLFASLLALPAFADNDELFETLRRTEYEISVQEGVHQAPNREHGFRTRFLESGIVVVPRTEVEKPWSWGLSWTGYGRGDVVGPVPEATLVAKGSRIDYLRDGHLEWYENSERGLKQSFLLAAPPADGSGPIRVDLALSGDLNPVISEDGQSIDFVLGSERVLRYTGLIVTDARGHEVPARMEGFVRGIRFVLDDSDAVYPITVDPLALAPLWTFESDQALAELGTSVATAGDVNGDGYSDVIVGAPYFDNGQVDEGRVIVFLGSASGLSTTPAWTAEADQAGAYFGQSVGTAGDVNGDGYADVIVGAYAYDNGEADEGRAYLYQGSATGLAATPTWTTEGNQTSAQYGWSVSTAGDVNGDGYSDVIVGTFGFDNGQTDEGRAWVYLGSPSGLSTAASWTAESDQAFSQFGNSVSTAGDVNGDGYADVIVGAPAYDNGQTNEGRAWVYHGSASGLSTTPGWTAESDQQSANFGWSVSTAGDANGDGYADVVVGAPDYSNGQNGEGRAYAYHGSATGLSTTASWTAESDQALARFGNAVATAGDTGGDGYADVLIGAEFYSGAQGSEGRAHMYRGSSAGLGTTASWTAEPNYAAAYFGRSLGTAGDVNGDGLSDVVVGAPGYDSGQNEEGRAFVYMGTLSRVLANVPATTLSGTQGGAGFGFPAVSAGDVNGDGYADVLVGAAGWDDGAADVGRAFLHLGSPNGLSTTASWLVTGTQAGEQLGYALSTAGDVDGDGYDDVLVASPTYDGFRIDGGRVRLYLGSSTGQALTLAWTAEGSTTGGRFGFQVDGGCDVNGDGFSDVAVGAYGETGTVTAEGRAHVFHGSPSGLSTTAAWIGHGGQPDSKFGYAVACRADANRDGFTDLAVGSPWYDGTLVDQGRAQLFLGSASGLLTSALWTVIGTQARAEFGRALDWAGDTNGDGHADLLVAAPLFDTSNVDAGAAHVYLGTSNGLQNTPVWTSNGGNVPSGTFGLHVAGVGDVEGDGLADFVVSAPSEPAVYGYFGSPAGPGTFPNWTLPQRGEAVGGAGDVNGDAFADVLVGGGLGFGTAQLFYGSGSPGIPFAPRQRVPDFSRAIARLGIADVAEGFRISAVSRSAFGRGATRLESEVKALGVPFDGLGTQVGDATTTGAVAHDLVDGLAARQNYRWRMRLRSDPARAPLAPPRGPWFGIPWGAESESMLRTLSPPAGRASNLRVEKAGAGVTVTYQKSCLPTDTLHAVFEGALGDFTSHVPVTCESVGSSWNFTPQVGNRYFLVAPLNADFEGSHGTNHAGAERPRGSVVCKPQNIGACP